MSFDPRSDWVVELKALEKSFRKQRKPLHRLLELLLPSLFLRGNRTKQEQTFTALKGINLSLKRGEVLGIVGVNGAGKSTLLQIIAGTLQATQGEVHTRGRVAALLELGSGFNPEFTGRENLRLNAAILGLTSKAIEERIGQIIDFAAIGEHIDQPVKTYSSGMQMRLAFAVATSVDADVLLIDEALSVGDGAFARKSFDRMMQVKQKGTSVLFCSHVLFHVEVFCDRVLWLDQGEIRAIGPPKTVQYQEYLDDLSGEKSAGDSNLSELQTKAQSHNLAEAGGQAGPMRGHARIVRVEVEVDGNTGAQLHGFSGRSLMRMRIVFKSDPLMPAPSAALVFSSQGGRIIGTNLSVNQAADVPRDQDGSGLLTIEIEPLRLNKGTFRVGAYLLCEKGIHVYQWIDPVATIDMHRDTYDQGYWMVEGRWHSDRHDHHDT